MADFPELTMGASRLRRFRLDPTLAGFILAACVALALMAATQWLAWQERRAAAWTLASQEVLGVLADTRAALVDIQNGHRGFSIEGTQEALQPYLEGRAAIVTLAARLHELLQDAPGQQADLAEFERLLPARLATAARIVETRRSAGFQAARQIVAGGAPAREMEALRAVLDAMDRRQEAIFRERVEQQRATLTRLATWVGGVTFLLLPALAMLYVQIRRRRRIDEEKARVAEQLQSLTETLEAQVALRTQELRQSNADLELAKQRLQQLSARIVEYQEQERRRVAYELHEDMAQSMSAIRIDLERAQRNADSGKPVSDAIKLLDALIAQTRDMVARLRPTMLDDLGLPEALEGELAQHARRNAWQAHLQVEPRDFPLLSPQVATACFRIAQEALFNAARHAQARHVDVSLQLRAGALELAVEDDGVGFEVAQHLAPDGESESFGLAFMLERARQVGGRLDIARGSGGRGMRVRLEVPLAGR
ncbi:MAG TPA: CHASE3 domain-containing protein [Ramlibacter sp.]